MNFSMLSAKESIQIGSSNRWVALYKGLKVAVYNVNKPEISLTRQDLVELINVRSSLFIYYLLHVRTVASHALKELYFEGNVREL